jgi:hypothetical protein
MEEMRVGVLIEDELGELLEVEHRRPGGAAHLGGPLVTHPKLLRRALERGPELPVSRTVAGIAETRRQEREPRHTGCCLPEVLDRPRRALVAARGVPIRSLGARGYENLVGVAVRAAPAERWITAAWCAHARSVHQIYTVRCRQGDELLGSHDGRATGNAGAGPFRTRLLRREEPCCGTARDCAA